MPGKLAAGTAPATPRFRRRGGWWARRAAACRAWTAAGGTAPRGASRRRTAWPIVGVPGRQAQRVGGDLHLVLDVVGAAGGGRRDDRFQLGLLGGQRVEVGVGLGVGGVDLLQARLGGHGLAQALFDRLAHRVLGVELRLLLAGSRC